MNISLVIHYLTTDVDFSCDHITITILIDGKFVREFPNQGYGYDASVTKARAFCEGIKFLAERLLLSAAIYVEALNDIPV